MGLYLWPPVKTGGLMHSEKPAGYGVLFSPPKPEEKAVGFGVKLDFATYQ